MRLTLLFCVLIITVSRFPVCGQTDDPFRSYFEWGEYQHLIDTLEPLLDRLPDTLKSPVLAQYHLYLGVAHFVKGRVDEAQKYFFGALSLDTMITPDREYLSDEINQFFFTTRSTFMEQMRHLRTKDSLIIVTRHAFDENLKTVKLHEFKKGRKLSTILSISLVAVGAVFAGVSVYEYYPTKNIYQDFRTAAQQGDRETYDKLQPDIRRRNIVITGAAIVAASTTTAGIAFGMHFLLGKPKL